MLNYAGGGPDVALLGSGAYGTVDGWLLASVKFLRLRVVRKIGGCVAAQEGDQSIA